MIEYLNVGAIVESISGREKGEIFLIISAEDDFVYLVNGINRTIENPKKKNKKHLHLLCKSEVNNLIMSELTDAQVKNFLSNYNKSRVK